MSNNVSISQDLYIELCLAVKYDSQLLKKLIEAKFEVVNTQNKIQLDDNPWYPDDSGEWIEVPDCITSYSSLGLDYDTKIEYLVKSERNHEDYCKRIKCAGELTWGGSGYASQIIAYKLV